MSKRWSEMDDLDLLQLENEMRDELGELRAAATVYADRAWARAERTAPVRTPAARGWAVWTAAGVTAAVLAMSGVRLLHHPGASPESLAGAPLVRGAAASPVSDEALLEQIQSDISGGVPAAMEPLQASTDTHAASPMVKR